MNLNKYRLFLLIIFFSLFTVLIRAQEAHEETAKDELAETDEIAHEETAQDEEETPPAKLTPEQQRIEMEIKVSTIQELAALCRVLGLPESGSRDDLSKRLRDHYGISEPSSAKENQKVITIESAETSEYFKIAAVDEEYARLRGNVKLSMKDGDSVHTISAEEILFNRTRNTLTASGGVVYEKTTGTDGTIETFKGSSITVNIDDWSSVFLGGMSERRKTGDETVYLFSGKVISRTDEEATILSNGFISSGTGEESYWSISASRIWLLPGQDFALLNAVLKVGNIPLLYLPVFFYPVDQMIFHPVFGYRPREGGFVQSTTYILGRPSSEEEPNSITKILGGSSDMDTERHGIFLKSTSKKTVKPNETKLRLLVDYYVNMGTFAALEFSLPRTKFLSQALDFNIGLGFTRTVSPIAGGEFSPYPPDYDGEFDKNHSNFFSTPVPFRYNLHFKSGINFKVGTISWDIPYYSDPFINRDFLNNRAESMDWFNITQDATEITTSQSAPTWNVNISGLNPQIKILAPYLSRLSVSTLSTSLTFTNLTDKNITNANSPTRLFFAPDTYTVYNISMSIGGAPLSLGQQRQAAAANNKDDIENPLEGIGEPISPWANEEVKEKITPDDLISPPVLSQSFNLPSSANVLFNVDYSLSPASSSVMQFMSGYGWWAAAEDVDWNDIQSILTSISGNANVNFNLNHSSGLFANKVTFSGDGRWRDFTFINEEAPAYSTPQSPEGTPDPARVETARREQYRHTRYSTFYEYNGTVRPLLGDPVFGQSSLQYNFKGTLVNSKRYADGEKPELTPVWGSWVKEDTSGGNEIYGLQSHQFTSTIQANVFDKTQNIRLSLDLPPRDTMISANATFRVWITETNINTKIRQNPDDALEKPGEWIYEPVNITETIRFRTNNSFVFNMVIKPEEDNDISYINTSLTLWNSEFKANLLARKTKKSYFHHEDNPDTSIIFNPNLAGRWERYGEDVLQPEKLSFSYNKAIKNSLRYKNIFDFTVTLGSSLTFDLIEHTKSIFTFSLQSNIKLSNLFEINLSASSDNSVIFRYFKGVPGMGNLTFMYREDTSYQKRQNNVFLDLIDSFNFFDEAARRRSGFKMGTFTVGIKHFLGDWEASLDVKMYPHLYQPTPARLVPKYEVTTDFTFLVQWKPISEFKADVKFEGQQDKWSLN